MGDWLSTVMKDIPLTTDKTFPSKKAKAAITADPRAVHEGKALYREGVESGTLQLFKQKLTGLDSKSSKHIGELLRDHWTFEINKLSLEILIRSITQYTFSEGSVDEIETSSDGTVFFYYVIKRNSDNDTDLAICYLKTSKRLEPAILFAGLLTEGLLGKDENDELYLQF